jgi:hypothetical protein
MALELRNSEERQNGVICVSVGFNLEFERARTRLPPF